MAKDGVVDLLKKIETGIAILSFRISVLEDLAAKTIDSKEMEEMFQAKVKEAALECNKIL